jgi:GT2 family glycosyltransferase
MGLRIPDRACLEQDVSCLTAACLKDVFLSVGGFDEELPIAFNDVDLCVRLRATKWRLIRTPAVGRHDSAQRVTKFANAVALTRKRAVLDAIPIALGRAYYLAFPPRTAPIA